jgi:hypothetical protein
VPAEAIRDTRIGGEMSSELETLRYPVGRYDFSAPVSDAQRDVAVRELAGLPGALRAAVAGLSDGQLDTPYRPGGWTVRQVVHHVADSHMQAFARFRWTLTEAEPTVKPYDQEAWSKLADMTLPVEVSLQLLEALHRRWDHLWRASARAGSRRGELCLRNPPTPR